MATLSDKYVNSLIAKADDMINQRKASVQKQYNAWKQKQKSAEVAEMQPVSMDTSVADMQAATPDTVLQSVAQKIPVLTAQARSATAPYANDAAANAAMRTNANFDAISQYAKQTKEDKKRAAKNDSNVYMDEDGNVDVNSVKKNARATTPQRMADAAAKRSDKPVQAKYTEDGKLDVAALQNDARVQNMTANQVVNTIDGKPRAVYTADGKLDVAALQNNQTLRDMTNSQAIQNVASDTKDLSVGEQIIKHSEKWLDPNYKMTKEDESDFNRLLDLWKAQNPDGEDELVKYRQIRTVGDPKYPEEEAILRVADKLNKWYNAKQGIFSMFNNDLEIMSGLAKLVTPEEIDRKIDEQVNQAMLDQANAKVQNEAPYRINQGVGLAAQFLAQDAKYKAAQRILGGIPFLNRITATKDLSEVFNAADNIGRGQLNATKAFGGNIVKQEILDAILQTAPRIFNSVSRGDGIETTKQIAEQDLLENLVWNTAFELFGLGGVAAEAREASKALGNELEVINELVRLARRANKAQTPHIDESSAPNLAETLRSIDDVTSVRQANGALRETDINPKQTMDNLSPLEAKKADDLSVRSDVDAAIRKGVQEEIKESGVSVFRDNPVTGERNVFGSATSRRLNEIANPPKALIDAVNADPALKEATGNAWTKYIEEFEKADAGQANTLRAATNDLAEALEAAESASGVSIKARQNLDDIYDILMHSELPDKFNGTLSEVKNPLLDMIDEQGLSNIRNSTETVKQSIEDALYRNMKAIQENENLKAKVQDVTDAYDKWVDAVYSGIGDTERLGKDVRNAMGRAERAFEKEGLSGFHVSKKMAEQIGLADIILKQNTPEGYVPPSYGYHAGDLGKAESLGVLHETGNFGRGTYFVGNEDAINHGNYAYRPHEMVDFSKYNLYRPDGFDQASRLNKFLTGVNAYYDDLEHSLKSEEEWDLLREVVSNEFDTIPKNELYDDMMRLYGKYDLERFVREYFGDEYSLLKNGNWDVDGKTLTPDELVDSVDFRDFAGRVTSANRYPSDAVLNRIEWNARFDDDARDLLGVNGDDARKLVGDIDSEIKRANYSDDDLYNVDSASTRLMKRLGYEGVDVRGIDGYDDVRNGSVIYDLKGADADRAASYHVPRTLGRDTHVTGEYHGRVPVQKGYTDSTHVVSESSYNRALQLLDDQSKTDKSIKTYVSHAYDDIYKSRGDNNIAVNNMTMEGEPYIVHIPISNIGKTVSSSKITPDFMAVLDELDQVIKNAEYVGTTPYHKHPKASNTNAIRCDYFEKPVSVNGNDYLCKLTVEVHPSSNNYKNHHLREINEINLEPITNGSSRGYNGATVNQKDVQGLFDNSITENGVKVNDTSVREMPERIGDEARMTIDPTKNTVEPAKSVTEPVQPDQPNMKTRGTYSNTMQNSDIFPEKELAENPHYAKEEFGYLEQPESESLEKASDILASNKEGQKRRFASEVLTPETAKHVEASDIDSIYMMIRENNEAIENAIDAAEIARLRRENGIMTQNLARINTNAGQVVQANAKWSRTPEGMRIQADAFKKGKVDEILKEADWGGDVTRLEDNIVKRIDELIDSKMWDDLKASDGVDSQKALDLIRDELAREINNAAAKAKQNISNTDIDNLAKKIQQKLLSSPDIDKIEDQLMSDDIWQMVAGVGDITEEHMDEALKLLDEAKQFNPNSKDAAKRIDAAYLILANDIGHGKSLMDKLDAWRYFAMLSKPTTHLRNMLGNTTFGLVTGAENSLSAVLEAGLDRASKIARHGEGIDRTKSLLGPQDADLISACARDFNNNAYGLYKGNKYYEDLAAGIEKMVKTFDNKGVGKAANFLTETNTALLDAEDVLFGQSKYATSLAGYLKANGYGIDALKSDDPAVKRVVEDARAYALSKANEATFHNNSALANAFTELDHKMREWSRLEAGNGNSVKKGIGLTMRHILPFAKTPSNILAAIVSRGPQESVKVIYDLVQLAKKNPAIKAKDLIEDISKTASGTMILGLGAYLYSTGHIELGGETDNERFNKKSRGITGPSLKFGNTYVALNDGNVPTAILAMGANLAQAYKDKKGGLDAFLDGLASVSDTVVDTTMLSGIADVINSARYSKNYADMAKRVGAQVATNAAGQYIPNLTRGIENVIDSDKRNTSYTGQTGLKDTIQKALQYGSTGIPMLQEGARAAKESGIPVLEDIGNAVALNPQVDRWGNDIEKVGGDVLGRLANNTINPTSITTDQSNALDKEIDRLYARLTDDTNGEPIMSVKDAKDLFVYTPNDESKFDGVPLSRDDWYKYQQERGKSRYDLMNAVVNSRYYRYLTDKEKATMLKEMDDISKNYTIEKYGAEITDKKMAKLVDAYKEGGAKAVLDIKGENIDTTRTPETRMKEDQKAQAEERKFEAASDDIMGTLQKAGVVDKYAESVPKEAREAYAEYGMQGVEDYATVKSNKKGASYEKYSSLKSEIPTLTAKEYTDIYNNFSVPNEKGEYNNYFTKDTELIPYLTSRAWDNDEQLNLYAHALSPSVEGTWHIVNGKLYYNKPSVERWRDDGKNKEYSAEAQASVNNMVSLFKK